MTNRKALLDKIRALLSKTVDNGCTEHEALAALDKASQMMDAYEVTEADLQLDGETATIFSYAKADPNNIRMYLAGAVARYCGVKVWRQKPALKFCGLPADVEFASWLIDTLARFVEREVLTHLWTRPAGEDRRPVADGFVAGCTRRISERLDALTQASTVKATANGRALVVTKDALIRAKMAELGIVLGKGRQSRRKLDNDAYRAGKAAGDRASFGRPVGGGAAKTLLLS